jgi:hypothetical protein
VNLLSSDDYSQRGHAPLLSVDKVKGKHIQISIGSASIVPFSCGGALDAPQLAAGVRRRFA